MQALDHPIFKQLSQAAKECDVKAYVVGGFVQDLMLKTPSKDIDVVVIGSGVPFAQHYFELIKSENKHISVFKNFGTAQIKTEDWVIEIIGARKESYRRDSRKPIVEDGSLADDQQRRDFSINSMYLSLNADDFGELLDPFNGIQDLQDGLIRTPNDPDITFSDDPLRMLRAIRFAARLGFKIEPTTWDGICRNAERIDIVSQERISDEFNAMILGKTPSR